MLDWTVRKRYFSLGAVILWLVSAWTFQPAPAHAGKILGEDAVMTLVVKVKVDRRAPSGKPWDFHNGKPDIYMCSAVNADALDPDHRKAYALDGVQEFCLAGHPQKPPMVSCNNSYDCTFYLVGLDPKRVNAMELSIFDADVQREHDDTIGVGDCTIGEKCRLGHATLKLSWKKTPWARLEKLEDCRARPKSVWIAGLPGGYTGRPWLGCKKLTAPPIRENKKEMKRRKFLERMRKVPEAQRKRAFPDP